MKQSFRHSFLWVLLFLSLPYSQSLYSQSLTGTLRGEITSKVSQIPISNAKIVLMSDQGTLSSQTDVDGLFRFDSLTVGRYDLLVSADEFRQFASSTVIISGKEKVLAITLRPQIYEMKEVLLIPDVPRGSPNNSMASVSALSFEVEETRKFAGGLDDPTRLAANFPGVVATPFISENFISIRGNSARGLLYRLEGVDIPNPNHFARIGSSGGSFTIFSNQVLANSDFFVGAFPAEYGNATSGVFDVHFRKGNNQQHEFTLQAGVLGVDLAAEGPLTSNKGASYLVNYRYATFNLVNHAVNYLSLPTYQDLSFKLHLPTEKAGTFSIFGIGGLSERLRIAELDSSLWERDLDRFDNVLASNMAAVGVKHSLLLKTGSLLRSTLIGSYSFLRDNKRYLESDLSFRQREFNEYTRIPLTFTSSIEHQFNFRHTNKTGIILNTTSHDYLASDYDYVLDRRFTQADEAGQTQTVQAYTQSKFQLSPQISATAGLHFLYFDLTQHGSLEPRASLSLKLAPRQTLSLGYGLHSRIEHWAVYMTRLESPATGNFSLPNQNLDFVKTHHMVLSYQAMLSDHLRFVGEGYYQNLFQVPVEVDGTWSVVNLAELDELRVLTNQGTARNVGVDLGLERFSRAGLYYMLNASVFNSTYTDISGNRHSTAFNTGYKANLLMGKEFKVGKKKGLNNLLGLNGALSVLGGQRFTPIDPFTSLLARETIFDETRPWEGQDKPLYILDFTLTLNRNHPKYSGTWVIQIKNLFSSSVPEYKEWDALLEEEVELRGATVLPILSYRVSF
ncbi:MAG: TonB-dependent receptor [Bacteroidota bacterium]